MGVFLKEKNVRTNKLLATVAALMLSTQVAHADQTVAYVEAKHQTPLGEVTMDLYLKGMGDGVEAAMGAYLANQNAPPIFCQPDKLVLDGAGYFTVLENFLRRQPRARAVLGESVSATLVVALIDTFPCRASRP